MQALDGNRIRFIAVQLHIHRPILAGGIHQLNIQHLVLRVAGNGLVHPVLYGTAAVKSGVHILRTHIVGKEHLHIIRGGEHRLAAVKPNEIHIPALGIDLGKGGGVGCHIHHIAVAFQAGQVAGFFHRFPNVALGLYGADPGRGGGVLAHKHMGTGAVKAVVAIVVVKQVAVIGIIMLVHHRVLKFPVNPRHIAVVSIPLQVSTGRGDHSDLRVFLFYCLVKRLEIAFIHGAPVLISQTDILQIKGLGVAVGRPQRAPVAGGGVAVGVLNQIQYILHIIVPRIRARAQSDGVQIRLPVGGAVDVQLFDFVRIFRAGVGILFVQAHLFRQIRLPLRVGHAQFGIRCRVVIIGRPRLAAEPHIHNGQRQRVQIRAQLEIFVVTHGVCVVIVPAVVVLPQVLTLLALLQGADGIFPIVQLIQAAALCQAPAGKADKPRVQILQRCKQVAAQGGIFPAVAAVTVAALGNQGDKIQV